MQSKRRIDVLFALLLLLSLLAILIAFVVASFLLLSKFVNIPLDSIIPDRLISLDLQLTIGVPFLLLIALFFAMLARWRIRRNRLYQFANGCPVCQRHDMIRVHRRSYHRWLSNILRLPIRKYACRNCQWQGVLLFYPIPHQFIEDEAETTHFQDLARQSSQTHAYNEGQTIQNMAVLSADIASGLPDEESLRGMLEREPSDQRLPSNSEVDRIAMPEVEPTVVDSLENEYSNADVQEKMPLPPLPSSAIVSLEELNVEQDYLTEADMPQEFSSKCGERTIGRAIVVAPFGLSLRVAAENSADIICSLEPDTIVELFELVDDHLPVKWRRVCYDGQVGFVSAAFIKHL